MQGEFENSKRDIYLVLTPRQWWLAHVLASQRKKPFVMIILESFQGAQELHQLNLESANSLLQESIFLPGKLTGKNLSRLSAKFFKTLGWFNTLVKLKKLLKKGPVASVFTANFNAIVMQFFYAKLSSQQTEFHVIDDGLNSYKELKIRKRSRLYLFQRSISYGFWMKYPPNGDVLNYYTHTWLLEPNKAARRFKGLKCHGIQRSVFSTEGFSNLKNKALQKFELNLTEWQKPKVVLVFSRTDYLLKTCTEFSVDGFANKLAGFLINNELTNSNIWIKYHPKEQNQDVFNLIRKFNGAQLIPQTIPFELLSGDLLAGDVVIGEISSALYDVALNFPQTNAVSLACLKAGSELAHLFSEVGVNIIEFD